jgi:hypothetical protein
MQLAFDELSNMTDEIEVEISFGLWDFNGLYLFFLAAL